MSIESESYPAGLGSNNLPGPQPGLPQPLLIEFENFDNVLSGISEEDRKKSNDWLYNRLSQYAIDTVQGPLSTLFESMKESSFGSSIDRNRLMIVDGKTVYERLRSIFDDQSRQSRGFDKWYAENGEQLGSKIVAAGLMAGLHVEAWVPDSSGELHNQPIQIWNTGYVPDKSSPSEVQDAWWKYLNDLGFENAALDFALKMINTRSQIAQRLGDRGINDTLLRTIMDTIQSSSNPDLVASILTGISQSDLDIDYISSDDINAIKENRTIDEPRAAKARQDLEDARKWVKDHYEEKPKEEPKEEAKEETKEGLPPKKLGEQVSKIVQQLEEQLKQQLNSAPAEPQVQEEEPSQIQPMEPKLEMQPAPPPPPPLAPKTQETQLASQTPETQSDQNQVPEQVNIDFQKVASSENKEMTVYTIFGAVSSALNNLFSSTEAAYHLDNKMAEFRIDRASLVIVDGKTLHERIQEQYLALQKNPSIKPFLDWYLENRDHMSAEIVMAALIAGKRVEAYLPNSDGTLSDKPIPIQNIDHPINEASTPEVLEVWANYCHELGFKETTADTLKEAAVKAKEAADKKEFAKAFADVELIGQAELTWASTKTRKQREAEKQRAIKEQQAMKNAEERLRAHYELAYRATKEPSSTLMKNMLFGQYMKDHKIEDWRAFSQLPTCPGYKLDRVAFVSACICMMAAFGHSLQDILDPTKLLEQKRTVAKLYMDHALKKPDRFRKEKTEDEQILDARWLGSVFYHGQKAILKQIDKIMEDTWNNPQQRKAMMPVLVGAGWVLADGCQEGQLSHESNLDSKVREGYLAAAEQDCQQHGNTSDELKSKGKELARDIDARTSNVSVFFKFYNAGDASIVRMAGPYPTKNSNTETNLADLGIKSLLNQRLDKMKSDIPFSQSIADISYRRMSLLHTNLILNPKIIKAATQLDEQSKNWNWEEKANGILSRTIDLTPRISLNDFSQLSYDPNEIPVTLPPALCTTKSSFHL